VASHLPAALRFWFADRSRALPWRVEDARGLRDPYCTWVSEIMLQQTRVEAVIPYFENFLQQFPHVADLAAASEEQVLKSWSGLGYYRRARMLHAAAKMIVADFEGQFPNNAEALRALPGVGTYTSAAIASLAFGERIPVVDGNVKRVVARLMALQLAADDSKLERAARQQGEVWMAALEDENLAAAGQLNEALMELGATVCLPRNPACEACPVAESCLALKLGSVAELPLPKKAKKWVDLEMVFLVHRVGARVLLTKREGGWSPGMFEPPSVILDQQSPEQAALTLQMQAAGVNEAPPAAAAVVQSSSLLGAAGINELKPNGPEPTAHGVVRHTITHHRIRAHVFALAHPPDQLRDSWMDPESVPLTGLARKVLQRAFV
jgi:A/G-specific adenine glycosylase